MPEIRDQFIAPTRWLYRGKMERAAAQGTVFFYHGLGSSKDNQDTELYSLAEAGFLAVGVDNFGHGERIYADFEHCFSSDNPDWGRNMLHAVVQTAQELPHLVNHFAQRGWINPQRMGLVGVSMGGYIAYQAALYEKRLNAVSVLLGSPYFWEEGFDSPHESIASFYPVALLSQNAGQDESVDPRHAREFHQKLSSYYHKCPEREQYIEFARSGHFMQEEDWETAWNNNLRWLGHFISR